MTRLLTIDADLSIPPSSPTAFREVTMIAQGRGYETLAVAQQEMLDPYHRWFKTYGLWDYLTDLLTPEEAAHEAATVQITCEPNGRLTVLNLRYVLGAIPT